jgi:hypothetical protein
MSEAFKQSVDSSELFSSYLREFTSFSRDALTLKNCWINYSITPSSEVIIPLMSCYFRFCIESSLRDYCTCHN